MPRKNSNHVHSTRGKKRGRSPSRKPPLDWDKIKAKEGMGDVFRFEPVRT